MIYSACFKFLIAALLVVLFACFEMKVLFVIILKLLLSFPFDF